MLSTQKTIYALILMLKKYGINNIVASPGFQNAFFNSIVQDLNEFRCYSVVDERSAAYFAIGISNEINKPVVITCTGATASRNYLSAMTEAFYRKVPIVALTFFNSNQTKFSMAPQFVDRSIYQNDLVYESVVLPKINDTADLKRAVIMINAALYTATHLGLPVHINCPSSNDFTNEISDFEKSFSKYISAPEYYDSDFSYLAEFLVKKDFGIFIGAHQRFSSSLQESISEFAKSYDIPVFCDHTSNYYGDNKILIRHMNLLDDGNVKMPELLIDIGSICGEYTSSSILSKAKMWRITEDGKYLSRSGKYLDKIFHCKEKYFFDSLRLPFKFKQGYFSYLNELTQISDNIDIPLSNAYVCYITSKMIPHNSSLHMSILNSLRCMNYFKLDNSVYTTCNVGGFGIDGPLSTVIGQACANLNKLTFAIIGDLAFFYDMNSLGLRQVPNNLRIIVVNNNKGEEFKVNGAKVLGDKCDELVAASEHYKNGVKGWVESCNVKYLRAETKEDFLSLSNDFFSKDSDKPIVLEVITEDKNETRALKMLRDRIFSKQ